MGCLLSCCGGDSDSESGDSGERTRLLTDSDRATACHGVTDGLHSDHASALAGPYSQSVPKATDEQSALSRILHDTATEIIDISAIEHTPGLEQQDYVERAAHYSKRLGAVGGRIVAKHCDKGMAGGELGAAQVERVLASEPISQTDLAVITEIAMRMDRAVKEMEVENREELVVPFGVN